MLNPPIRIIIWVCLQQQICLYNFPKVNIAIMVSKALEGGIVIEAGAATTVAEALRQCKWFRKVWEYVKIKLFICYLGVFLT